MQLFSRCSVVVGRKVCHLTRNRRDSSPISSFVSLFKSTSSSCVYSRVFTAESATFHAVHTLHKLAHVVPHWPTVCVYVKLHNRQPIDYSFQNWLWSPSRDREKNKAAIGGLAAHEQMTMFACSVAVHKGGCCSHFHSISREQKCSKAAMDKKAVHM